jgi:putative membrane protein
MPKSGQVNDKTSFTNNKKYNKLQSFEGYNKIIIICIDRDDDIGTKGKIETPIIGKDLCTRAGTRLAIEDPEDSDCNAIFGAIKSYEDFRIKGYDVEVSLVAGKYNRGIEGDAKIAQEIDEVLDKYNADGAVVVSDGEDDETVIPVIQGKIPIISIQRIIVRQSRSVEYSYAILGRYIKILFYDPRYSKFFLGLPGALFITSGLSILFGFSKVAFALGLSILGLAFVVRAFDIDKSIATLSKPTPSAFIRIFSYFAGTLIILASILNGISHIPPDLIESQKGIHSIITNKTILEDFVSGSITLLWIGISTIFAGILLSNWFKGSIKIIYDILRLVVLALLYIPMLQFTSLITARGNPFNLISSLLIGLAITLIVATFLFQYFRNRKGGEELKNDNQ